MFTDLSWFFVLDGLGVRSRDYSPLVDTVDFNKVRGIMNDVRGRVAAAVTDACTHDSFFAAVASFTE